MIQHAGFIYVFFIDGRERGAIGQGRQRFIAGRLEGVKVARAPIINNSIDPKTFRVFFKHYDDSNNLLAARHSSWELSFFLRMP